MSATAPNIRILGAIEGDLEADGAVHAARKAARLLETRAIELAHGQAFTGKSDTRIHADAIHVLKYRLDRRFDHPDIAAQWAHKRLQTERERGVFHPGRIWLTLPAPDGRGALAGNLSLRLDPLHTIDWAQTPEPETLLAGVADLYYRHLALAGERLDEGLSNFALDHEGRLFYFDDDFYPWDDHHAFAAMVGQWLRTFAGDWLDDARAFRLGDGIAAALKALPRIEADLFAQALEDVFLGDIAAKRRRCLLEGFHAALHPAATPLARSADDAPIEPDWNTPVGLVADIHANLPALEAVWRVFEAHGIRQFFCLGDIVGYGPDPAACIAWLRRRRVFTIRGNHDHFVAHGHGKVAMSQTARATAEWSQARLSDADKLWLAGLPLKYQRESLLAVHGAPVDRSYFNGYVYETTWERNLDWMVEHGMRIGLHGHSHLQGGWCIEPDGAHHRFDRAGVHRLAQQANLLNPGAVGQPRNRRPGAQAAILDLSRNRIELLQVDYDIQRTIDAIRAAGLPNALIERLIEGR